jgi:iron complex outermembrane receptor protein
MKLKTTYNKKTLLAFTIGSLLASPNAAFAFDEESEVKDVERIEVTGSRIKRVDSVSAVPVNVIDAVMIEKSGFSTVAEVLQFSTFNAEGSGGNKANNTWSSQQTVEIRGQSVFHSLILIDGQRMAKSPILDGGASSINDIPLAAVSRIEILTDGASAVYGSDAIAGVVNIILKKEFDGVEVKLNAERTEIDAGDRNTLSLIAGTTTDKSSSLFVYEHDRRTAVTYADIDYAGSRQYKGTDPDDIQNNFGYSPNGRTVNRGDWLSPQIDGNCDTYGSEFKAFNDSEYPSDRICAYDYGATAGINPEQTRDNVLASYQYELSDTVELSARAYWTHMNSIDISAPVPAGVKITTDLPATDDYIAVGPGDSILYRFNEFGNRTADVTNDIQDINIGLVGDEDAFTWDLNYSFNRYTSRTFGTNYLNTAQLSDAVGEYDEELGHVVGWDPRDANSSAPESLKANYDRHLEMQQQGITGGVGFEVFDLSAGSVGVYVGASYREEAYENFINAAADNGDVAGGAGGSAGASSREIAAVFAESNIPVLENLDVNIAARYDDYSDFGDTFNPQISARYTPIDDLVLRASWGTGFRAPTLVDINQRSSIGFQRVRDYVSCLDNGYIPGGSTAGCSRPSVPVDTAGNKELKPETSVTWNVGFAYNITDDAYIKADYWSIEIEDIIGQMSANDIVQHQARLIYEGSDLDIGDVFPGAAMTQGPTGKLTSVASKGINNGESERRGVDIEMGYKLTSDFGDFSAVVNWAHLVDYTETDFDIDSGVLVPGDNISGEVGKPKDIANLSLSWEYDEHRLSTFTSYYGKQKDISDDGSGNALPSWAATNLTYQYALPWDARVSLKVLNILDRQVPMQDFEPSISSGDYRLYPNRGRALAVSYTFSF